MKRLLFVLLLTIWVKGLKSQDNPGREVESLRQAGHEIPWHLLPQPLLEDDSCWLDMYRYCWKEAFQKIRQPYPGSGFVSDYIDEGFNPNIFMWDTQFMLLFWKYAHTAFPAVGSNDNFYAKQHKDGYICREIREKDGKDVQFMGKKNTINPPLFAYAEYEYLLMTGDTSRITKILPPLFRFAAWLQKHRVKKHSAHQLFWQKSFGSGMDNCPRKGNGWVDMSSQMVIFYKYLSLLCESINDKDNSRKYKDMADELIVKINKWMWDQRDGFYYDVKNNGGKIRNMTIAAFWTMLAGVCSQEQFAALNDKLKDTSLFFRTIPFPSLPATHTQFHGQGGNYWQGGVWAPTDYMILKGLDNYEDDGFSCKATEKLLKGVYSVFTKTGTAWENYSPDYEERGNRSKGEFVGWTGIIPITLLIENIIGIRAHALNNTVTWHISRYDKHGIKNFRFGSNNLDLICDRRAPLHPGINITVNSKLPFTLKIISDQGTKEFYLDEGTSRVNLP